MELQILHSRYRSRRPEVFCKKGTFQKFANSTGKHREFCEILKNTFFYITPLMTASVDVKDLNDIFEALESYVKSNWDWTVFLVEKLFTRF